MNKQYIGVLIIFVIIIGAISIGFFFENSTSRGDGERVEIPFTDKNLPKYTMAQVSQHSSSDDCFIVVDENVYDITSYVSGEEHPGGQKSIISGCGNNETDRFGRIHSPKANEDLKEFLIGIVE